MTEPERIHWWVVLMQGAVSLHDRGYRRLAYDLRSVAMSAFSKPESWSQRTGEQR